MSSLKEFKVVSFPILEHESIVKYMRRLCLQRPKCRKMHLTLFLSSLSFVCHKTSRIEKRYEQFCQSSSESCWLSVYSEEDPDEKSQMKRKAFSTMSDVRCKLLCNLSSWSLISRNPWNEKSGRIRTKWKSICMQEFDSKWRSEAWWRQSSSSCRSCRHHSHQCQDRWDEERLLEKTTRKGRRHEGTSSSSFFFKMKITKDEVVANSYSQGW